MVTEASLEEVEEEARACVLAPWEVPRFVLRRDPFDEKECSAHGKIRRHVVAAAHGLNDRLRGDHAALLRREKMLREDRRHDKLRRPAHDACRALTAAAHGFGCSVKCRDAGPRR